MLSHKYSKNTFCYSNAILQCIASCICFSDFSPSENHPQFPLNHAFASLMNSMVGSETSIDPSLFMNVFMPMKKIQFNRNVCTMILHEPMDNVSSTNQILYYSSPKTSEDAHEFIMALQEFLLDELENSEKNPGHTCYEEIYDNDLYLSMKAFWDLFTGEITHEYTCTSCKSTFQNQEPINYLLLKFPDVHREHDQNCTVEFLIEYHLQEEKIDNYRCFCKKSAITMYPSFMCILLCRSRRDNNGTISSAVQFHALGFDIKGNNMPYDLSATVHHTPRRSGSGHYTAISRSRELQQSHE
jgi:hypothetical protein